MMGAMETRERIIEATARLLANAPGEPIAIRDVCAAAGVGAPTVYHHFGDKQGLLDAVVEHGFERYIAAKRAEKPSDDPLADMRAGWDAHTQFARENPAFYALMYGTVRPGHRPAAAAEAQAMLEALLRRIEAAGRLRLAVPAAARLVLAANVGVALALITGEEDPLLSERAREAIFAAVVAEEPGRGVAPDAPVADGAGSARGRPPLTPAERAVLREWLAREQG